MTDIPIFQRYSGSNPAAREQIQPNIGLRAFGDLDRDARKTALQYVINQGWIDKFSGPALGAVSYLNGEYLAVLPGKKLHRLGPPNDVRTGEDYDRLDAAYEDFSTIFLDGPEALVLEMLSVFQHAHIDRYAYSNAEKATDHKQRDKYVADAFVKFDRLANCLNHVFEQFSVNQKMTRLGLVPRQDEAITESVYEPTLRTLADPKWASVSRDLASMFVDFRAGNYAEVVTKAHTAVQRFLQVWTGNREAKNGPGELGDLIAAARQQGLFPAKDRFIAPMLNAILSFLPSERATKSTAKPSQSEPSPTEALLVMNTVLVLLQYCLQQSK